MEEREEWQRIWEEYKRVNERIKEQDEKIEAATSAKASEELITDLKERRDRLFQDKSKTWEQLDKLQALLAGLAGQIAAHETVRELLQNPSRQPLGSYVDRLTMSSTTTMPSLVHQAARVLPWCEFDEGYLPTFIGAIPEDVLCAEIRARQSYYYEFKNEADVQSAFELHVWPVLTEAAHALGLNVKIGVPRDSISRKPRSRSDQFCTVKLGGEEVKCAAMECKTKFAAPSMRAYMFVEIYDASKAGNSTAAGKVHYQLQQLVGAVRADVAEADPTIGGVGMLFTDEAVHGVFYIEDDVEGDKMRNVPCQEPARSMGQKYCSGTAYVTRQYRFDEGGPTAEAAILALAAFGKQLCEKQAALPAEQRERRRALLMLPLLARLPGQGEERGEVQLEEIIGEGASGIVRRAFINGREAAAKLPVSDDLETMESIRHEAEVMCSKQIQQLHGLAVVPVIAAGTAAGMPFLAMEMMGPSAAEAPPLSAEQEHAAISGLMRLHEAGVIHGDARLENLLRPRDNAATGVPMWADFGRAVFSRDRSAQEAELAECKRLLAMQRRHTVLRYLSRAHARVRASYNYKSCKCCTSAALISLSKRLDSFKSMQTVS